MSMKAYRVENQSGRHGIWRDFDNENTAHCGNAALQVTRPPQSWCYVEELNNG